MFLRGMPLDPPRAGMTAMSRTALSLVPLRSVRDALLDVDRAEFGEDVGDLQAGGSVAIDVLGGATAALLLGHDGVRNGVAIMRDVDHIASSLPRGLPSPDVHDGRSDEGSFANAAR